MNIKSFEKFVVFGKFIFISGLLWTIFHNCSLNAFFVSSIDTYIKSCATSFTGSYNSCSSFLDEPNWPKCIVSLKRYMFDFPDARAKNIKSASRPYIIIMSSFFVSSSDDLICCKILCSPSPTVWYDEYTYFFVVCDFFPS